MLLATTSSSAVLARRPVRAAAPAPIVQRRRLVLTRADGEGTAGKVTERSGAGPDQPPKNTPEVARATAEQQGGAPEGDKAILGQKAQPLGQKSTAETPEERFGSAEKAREFAEASKDRTRRSELQTEDENSNNAGEGSSA